MRLAQLVDRNHGTLRGWVRMALAQTAYALGGLDRYEQQDLRAVRRLVFVCLGNINRSAFADAVACRRGLRSCSIGLSTTAGAPATPLARDTAARLGIDLTGHAATTLEDYRHQGGDLLLVMELRHLHWLVRHGVPVESIALLGRWSAPLRIHLHDPHTLSAAYFETVFQLIHSAVDHLFADLRRSGSPAVNHEHPADI